MKYTLIFILLILLLAVTVLADTAPEDTVAVTPTDSTPTAYNEKAPGGSQVGEDASVKQSGDGWIVNGEFTPKGGSPMMLVNGKIDANGKILHADNFDVGSAKGVDATDFVSDAGGYTIGSVGSLQQGPIVITNGKNVKYENGCLSADSAESLVETDTVATKIDKLNYCDKTIDVKEADSVWAGCVLMEDVEDASITAGTDVVVEADEGTEFTIKDCATHEFDFTSLSDDSKLIISKNTVVPTFELTDVDLALETANFTESVATNGTAMVEVSRIDGIQKVHMTATTIYKYDASDPEQDFSVRAWQDDHDLYLKKSMSDALPAEVKDCNGCSIADLANHHLEIRGTIDFNKNQLAPTTNQGLSPFFTTANKNAKAILSFDDNNAFVKELLILNDAPPYRTYVSNYLTISEAVQVGTATQRLLKVNEAVEKKDLTASWLGSYRTTYSPATLKVENNVLDYQRNGVVLKVLPDQHKDINVLLQNINKTRLLVFMSVAGLIGGLGINLIAGKKKLSRGQLTIFMLIGIVLMAVIGMMLYLVGVLSLPNQLHITDKEQVQTYVTQCLQMSGKSSIIASGLQGGHLALQPPFNENPKTAFLYETGNNNLLTLERMELDISQDTTTKLLTCLDNFEAFTGVKVETIGSPDVKTILGIKDSTFQLDYKFFVHKGDQRWDFESFATTVPIGMLKAINAANATVTSEIQNDEQINLDAIPSSIYTFFPLNNILIAIIDGDAQFVFANKR
ncbi:MAG: hypothetical protein AABY01_00285 [Nanoarchaeota archaeon]